jgi:DNA invertase Pin-like site-specific DNA recombinase
MITYGYARVSTDEQSTANQVEALRQAGCTKIFKDDGITGATMARPGLKRLLRTIKPGDRLVVTKMDRLARSLKGLIEVLDGLKEKQVEFTSLGEAIDTSTPVGRAMWQLLGVFAELERSMIVERTRTGRNAAKRRGVQFGRKPSLSIEQVTAARRMVAEGRQTGEIASALGVERTTLWRALRATA